MKRFSRKQISVAIVALAILASCGYVFFFYEPYDRIPDDPRYREILREFFAAQPLAVNISPNGEYVLTKAELETGGFQITVQDWKSSRVLFTNFSANSQRSLTWRPDSMAIVFQEIDGLDRPLYLWDFKTGKKKKLNVPVSKTALPPLRWNPSGKKLAYFHGDWNKGRLLVIDPEQKNPHIVIKESMSGTCDFVWSPDGSSIALTTVSEPGVVTITRLNPLRSSEVEIGADAQIKSLAWSSDGKSILAAARRDNNEYFKLFEIEPSSSKVSLRSEADGDIENPVWLSDGKTFIYHVLSDGIIHGVLGNHEHASGKIIGPTNGVLRVTHLSPDGKRLYARFASLSKPPTLIEIPVKTGEASLVYTPPKSEIIRCPEPESIRIKAEDGTLIPAYHWKAKDTSSHPTAVLIDVHGGLHTQSYPTWESYIQVMTKRGCDVIALNYRGSSGYGRAFEDMGEEDERVLDVVAARNYAANVLHVIPNKIYLMGNSHGSGLVAAAAAHGEEMGGIILISWAGGIHGVECRLVKPISVLGFQGTLDPFVSPREARNAIQKFFAPSSDLAKIQWQVYRDEGHFFYRTDSWSKICWGLMNIQVAMHLN